MAVVKRFHGAFASQTWPVGLRDVFLSTRLDYELQLLDDPFTQECQRVSCHINPFIFSSLHLLSQPNHLTPCSFKIMTN